MEVVVGGVLLVLVFCVLAQDDVCKRVIIVDRETIPTLYKMDGVLKRSAKQACNRSIVNHATVWMSGRPGWSLKTAHCRALSWLTYET